MLEFRAREDRGALAECSVLDPAVYFMYDTATLVLQDVLDITIVLNCRP